MNLLWWIGQAIGLAGIALNVAIYQQRTRKKLLLFKFLSDIMWFLHYGFLGAFSGAAVGLIGCGREFVFMHTDKKWASKKIWVPIFICISIISAAMTWKSIWSILPACASVISVLSFARSDPKTSRFLCFIISACMLTYDVTCLSYSGMANEVLTVISGVIGVIRYDIKKNDMGIKETIE